MMAPHKPLKTYAKPSITNARRRVICNDSSSEDPFELLRNAPNYNPINVTDNPNNISASSDSECSGIKPVDIKDSIIDLTEASVIIDPSSLICVPPSPAFTSSTPYKSAKPNNMQVSFLSQLKVDFEKRMLQLSRKRSSSSSTGDSPIVTRSKLKIKEVEKENCISQLNASGEKEGSIQGMKEQESTHQVHPLCNGKDTSVIDLCEDSISSLKRFNVIKPGKKYRRSLLSLKRQTAMRCSSKNQHSIDNHDSTLGRSRVVAVTNSNNHNSTDHQSILESYSRLYMSYVPEHGLLDADLDNSIRNLSLNGDSPIEDSHITHTSVVTAKDIVLRRCGQAEPLPFEELYPNSVLQHCQKIGDGVYGEVFLYRNKNGLTTVMKVIPIEGDQIVNGERQKKFDEILSEIVISMELSNLRNSKMNNTSSFIQVQKIACVYGSYPQRLLQLWELYEETHGSENDSPELFQLDQLYIVLELNNGGTDLEAFIFNNALQALSIFKQVACALAAAESQLKFEHRDLHWGNVLISHVDKAKKLHYKLDGEDIVLASNGVEASIIDFTLSRMEFDDLTVFNDLSEDNELFEAGGDLQFETYRMMQRKNGNEWKHFEPYSNILWLYYLLDKSIKSLRYKNKQSKTHNEYIEKLQKLKEEVLAFSSCAEFVKSHFVKSQRK